MPSVAHACPDDESGPVSAASHVSPAGSPDDVYLISKEDVYRVMEDRASHRGADEDPIIAWFVDEATTVDVSKHRPTPALLKRLQEAAQQRRGALSANSGTGEKSSPVPVNDTPAEDIADRSGLVAGTPCSGKSSAVIALMVNAARRAAPGPAPRSRS
jgi:hypothetical protein